MASSNNITGDELADATTLLNRATLNANPQQLELKITTKPQDPEAKPDFDKNPLTFGIEFEFVVMATMKDRDNSAPHPVNSLSVLTIDHSDPDADKIVARFFDDAKHQGITPNYLYVVEQAIKSVFRENSVKSMDPSWGTQISKGWWNKNDTSIRFPGAIDEDTWKLTDLPDYEFAYYGVEVVSPILPATSSGFDEAKKVADLLDTEVRTMVNRSCGLHVHVGDGKNGFSLETLTNVIGILWIFDREINRLHPKFRKSLSGNAFCRAFVAYNLGRWPDAGAIKNKLLEFYTATSHHELNCMIGHKGRYVAYNFENLSLFVNATDKMKTERGGYHETIEFRQHEATLKGDRVKHWAQLCVALVEWAMRTNTEDMKATLLSEHEKQQKGKGMAIWELAKFLGLDDAAYAFEEFVYEKEHLSTMNKRIKDKKYTTVTAELTTSLMAIDSENDVKLQTAQAELQATEKEYNDISEIHYSKGANRPCTIIKYDSDNESEYAEEVAYYGTVGIKPQPGQEKRRAKCYGENEHASHAQFCPRCRPNAPVVDTPVSTEDEVNAAPMYEGWEKVEYPISNDIEWGY